MKVYSGGDVELAYFLIHLLKENGAATGSGKHHDLYVETVRSLREFCRRESDRRIIEESDYGSYTALVELPAYVENEEDAEEWFEEEERREYVPSQYDCTGQSFTMWYKMVKRRGRWYCYHRIGLDV